MFVVDDVGHSYSIFPLSLFAKEKKKESRMRCGGYVILYACLFFILFIWFIILYNW